MKIHGCTFFHFLFSILSYLFSAPANWLFQSSE